MVRHVFLSNDLSPSNVFFFRCFAAFRLFFLFSSVHRSLFFFSGYQEQFSLVFVFLFSPFNFFFFLLFVFLVLDGSHASFTTSPMRSNRSLGCVLKKE